jgi:hypothetical protein
MAVGRRIECEPFTQLSAMLSLRIYPLAVLVALAGLAAPAEEEPTPPDVVEPDISWSLLPPPKTADGQPAAEVVDLPEPPAPRLPKPALKVPGYKTVLSGHLAQDIELTAANSPALIHGALLVPSGRTLSLKPGAVLYLRPDPKAAAPTQKGEPDARSTGTLWIGGRLLADGLNGARIEIAAEKGQTGGLFFAGSEMSELRGVNLKRVGITQSSGSIQWLGCELTDTPHYALAGGAALLVHCSLRRNGGLFATYDAARWALLINRCQFEECREGLVFRNAVSPQRLLVEQNAFERTAGANLRALPVTASTKQAAKPEILIGENWYGTAVPEQIDARIIDRRSQKNIRLWLNTRPPAEQPYKDIGAAVPVETLARSLQEIEPVRTKLLKSLGDGKETVQTIAH